MGYYRSDATGKLTKYAGSNNRGYMPLGMVFASSVELEEFTVKRLNGQNLSINGAYNQFCYWLMDQGSKAPTCDIATYATEITSYGQCGRYVINNTSTAQTSGSYTVPAYSIKLPTITEFVASNNGGDAVGLAELDMFKKHRHTPAAEIEDWAGDSRYNLTFYNSNYGGDYSAYQQPVSEGSRGMPTSTGFEGGEETRPKNIRYPYYIVVAQGVRLQALVDMEQVASNVEELQDKASRTEQVEVVYDKNDPNKLLGMSGGINGTTNIDFSKYKRIRIYYKAYYADPTSTGGGSNILELDVKNALSGLCRAGNIIPYYQATSIAPAPKYFAIVAYYYITSHEFNVKFYYENGQETNQSQYHAYKIEGVY